MMLDPRLVKVLQSKDFKKAIKLWEQVGIETDKTLKILQENTKLYSGLALDEEGEPYMEEQNDRVNYYKFMQETSERLDNIEKKLDEILELLKKE